jgi:hypothetical protein
MLILKTKIKVTAELVQPLPKLSMEEAMAEFTDSYQAEATKEIMDEWGNTISARSSRGREAIQGHEGIGRNDDGRPTRWNDHDRYSREIWSYAADGISAHQ